MKRARILYAGWGFTPFRGGGSVRYAEALMRGMAKRGHAVGHFCTGRYGVSRAPSLRRWDREAIREFELWNGPVLPTWGTGTKAPRLEIGCRPVEDAFRSVIREFRPDLIHFHEFVTMPASLGGVARAEGAPYLCSLHDYATVCATCLLYRYDRSVCFDYRDGADCVRCCSGAPADSSLFRLSLLAYSAFRGKLPAFLEGPAVAVKRVLRGRTPNPAAALLEGDAAGFVARRRAFLEALAGARMVLPVSQRVTELLAIHGSRTGNFRVLHPTLPHLDEMRHRIREAPKGSPLRLGYLGTCLPSKGIEVIFEALSRLPHPSRFSLTVHGECTAAYRRELKRRYPSAKAVFTGPYGHEELDARLEGVDVGILPSLTEETYGLVGLEFLAAGIPLIASRIGGIPEFLRDGENGLLFPAGNPELLASLIGALADSPARIAEMSRNCLPGERFDTHLAKVEGIYGESLS